MGKQIGPAHAHPLCNAASSHTWAYYGCSGCGRCNAKPRCQCRCTLLGKLRRDRRRHVRSKLGQQLVDAGADDGRQLCARSWIELTHFVGKGCQDSGGRKRTRPACMSTVSGVLLASAVETGLHT